MLDMGRMVAPADICSPGSLRELREFKRRLSHKRVVELMHFEALADATQHGHRELSAKMLAELVSTREESRVIGEERVAHRKAECRNHRADPRVVGIRKPALEVRVTAVEQEPKRNRVAV